METSVCAANGGHAMLIGNGEKVRQTLARFTHFNSCAFDIGSTTDFTDRQGHSSRTSDDERLEIQTNLKVEF